MFANILPGWKTHILTTMPALALLGIVIIEKFVFDIPGVSAPADWVTLVLGGLGLGALRSGVAAK